MQDSSRKVILQKRQGTFLSVHIADLPRFKAFFERSTSMLKSCSLCRTCSVVTLLPPFYLNVTWFRIPGSHAFQRTTLKIWGQGNILPMFLPDTLALLKTKKLSCWTSIEACGLLIANACLLCILAVKSTKWSSWHSVIANSIVQLARYNILLSSWMVFCVQLWLIRPWSLWCIHSFRCVSCPD